MSGHTPGPWGTAQGQNAGNIGVRARGAAELFRVAYVPVLPMDGCREEAEANARLIAAAPELLSALKRLAAFACHTAPPDLYEAVYLAIAKAEGR